MRKWIDLCESAPRTLYHGTLKEYLPEIGEQGLVPTVGDFVLTFYDPSFEDGYDPEYDSLEPLIFAATKSDIQRCVSAIIHRLRDKRIPPSPENIVRYGAVLVIKDHNEQFEFRSKEDVQGYEDHPTQVEPGDFYSYEEVTPAYVLTGKKLKDLLRRNRIDGFTGMRPPIRPTVMTESDLRSLAKRLDADGLQHIKVEKEQWLVHFTGYEEEISRQGFTKGTPPDHIGWKGTWGDKFNQPGFNFASAMDDDNALEFWAWQCPSAVVFRAEGVSCWHKDGFDQVIFWGPAAKRPIYAIQQVAESTSAPELENWRITFINGTSPDEIIELPFYQLLSYIERA